MAEGGQDNDSSIDSDGDVTSEMDDSADGGGDETIAALQCIAGPGNDKGCQV